MNYRFKKTEPYRLLEGHLKMGQTNPAGDEINVNNLYLTKNGKPYCPVMAEMHISRVRRIDWEDRILKMKAAGINIISSYLFWINHESVKGVYDFEGENDIHYFIEMCQKHNMYFALRIGPWVNAEYRNGGLPDWLFRSKIKIRDNNEEYLAHVKRWYQAVYDQIRDLLFINGGNIIMIQFDNELTIRPEHIMELKNIALSIGLTAPIYTATGWNLVGGARLPKDEVVPMWGGYAAKPWTQHINSIPICVHYVFSPDRNSAEIGNDLIEADSKAVNLPLDRYPYTYCELGTGIPDSKHRRPVIRGIDDYAFSLVKLGSGTNLFGFYMFCGGKNQFSDTMTYNRSNEVDEGNNSYPIIGYDFQSPVGAYGNIKESYLLLKQLNLFENDFGAELLEMQTLFQENTPKANNQTDLRYALRRKGDKGYIFVNNHARLLDKQAVENVKFELPNGEVIPKKGIHINKDVAFFFPYNISYAGIRADYILAQPLIKHDKTYFFKVINGIEPIFKFKDREAITASIGKDNGFTVDGVTFITFSEHEACFLYRFESGIYIGEDCFLIEKNGIIQSCGYGEYAYYIFEKGKFEYRTGGKKQKLADVSFSETVSSGVDDTYFYEFHNMCKSGERLLHFYDIEVTGNDGYLYIDYSGDSAQIYVDGKLFDDHFYNGIAWIIPAEPLNGKKVVLVIAEYTKDIYVEIEPQSAYGIHSITVKPN